MDITMLVKLTARAWSMDILALMHTGTPGRQASLVAASGAGRTALTQSLEHLISIGLLERNPGHGHPLRPEYRMTPEGAAAAIMADKITRASPEVAGRNLLRRMWTVPILVVSQQPRHFTDIKTVLNSITDRALSQSLKQLQAQHWLERTVDSKIIPTRPLYKAANAGARIARVAGVEFF